MTSRDFCYWLQGFFEIVTAGFNNHPSPPQIHFSPEAIRMIQAHLALVFKHEIDPSAGPTDYQKLLDQIHDAAKQQAQGGGFHPGVIARC